MEAKYYLILGVLGIIGVVFILYYKNIIGFFNDLGQIPGDIEGAVGDIGSDLSQAGKDIAGIPGDISSGLSQVGSDIGSDLSQAGKDIINVISPPPNLPEIGKDVDIIDILKDIAGNPGNINGILTPPTHGKLKEFPIYLNRDPVPHYPLMDIINTQKASKQENETYKKLSKETGIPLTAF